MGVNRTDGVDTEVDSGTIGGEGGSGTVDGDGGSGTSMLMRVLDKYIDNEILSNVAAEITFRVPFSRYSSYYYYYYFL